MKVLVCRPEPAAVVLRGHGETDLQQEPAVPAGGQLDPPPGQGCLRRLEEIRQVSRGRGRGRPWPVAAKAPPNHDRFDEYTPIVDQKCSVLFLFFFSRSDYSLRKTQTQNLGQLNRETKG